jgi:hypothetical protein
LAIDHADESLINGIRTNPKDRITVANPAGTYLLPVFVPLRAALPPEFHQLRWFTQTTICLSAAVSSFPVCRDDGKYSAQEFLIGKEIQVN